MTAVPLLLLFLALCGASPVGASPSDPPGVCPREEPRQVRPFLGEGRTGEEEQQVFLEQVTRWAFARRSPVFYFEAFDHVWKGGEHPDEVEKQWGPYRADRTPRRAVAGRTEP